MEKCNGNDLCQFIAFAEKDEKLGTSSLCVLYDRCEYVAVHKRFKIFERGCKGNILEKLIKFYVFYVHSSILSDHIPTEPTTEPTTTEPFTNPSTESSTKQTTEPPLQITGKLEMIQFHFRKKKSRGKKNVAKLPLL